MDKLKPCPFCGAKAILYAPSINDSWSVICQNEDAECNVRLLYCNSKEEAIEQWNRRVDKQ